MLTKGGKKLPFAARPLEERTRWSRRDQGTGFYGGGSTSIVSEPIRVFCIPVTIPVWDYRAEYEAERDDILAAVDQVLRSGRLILGDSVRAFEHELAAYCGARHGVGVNSGTDALVLALHALDVKAGDEVITTSNTAIPTVSAIVSAGATPRFVDIEPDTGLMDVSRLDVGDHAANARHRPGPPVRPVRRHGRGQRGRGTPQHFRRRGLRPEHGRRLPRTPGGIDVHALGVLVLSDENSGSLRGRRDGAYRRRGAGEPIAAAARLRHGKQSTTRKSTATTHGSTSSMQKSCGASSSASNATSSAALRSPAATTNNSATAGSPCR